MLDVKAKRNVVCCQGRSKILNHKEIFFKEEYTGCLKIREFRIQSVVGDHFSSPNMEIKKNRDSPHRDTLV
jgi:hypothetical protein